MIRWKHRLSDEARSLVMYAERPNDSLPLVDLLQLNSRRYAAALEVAARGPIGLVPAGLRAGLTRANRLGPALVGLQRPGEPLSLVLVAEGEPVPDELFDEHTRLTLQQGALLGTVGSQHTTWSFYGSTKPPSDQAAHSLEAVVRCIQAAGTALSITGIEAGTSISSGWVLPYAMRTDWAPGVRQVWLGPAVLRSKREGELDQDELRIEVDGQTLQRFLHTDLNHEEADTYHCLRASGIDAGMAYRSARLLCVR